MCITEPDAPLVETMQLPYLREYQQTEELWKVYSGGMRQCGHMDGAPVMDKLHDGHGTGQKLRLEDDDGWEPEWKQSDMPTHLLVRDRKSLGVFSTSTLENRGGCKLHPSTKNMQACPGS
jgi:hypothetical protein